MHQFYFFCAILGSAFVVISFFAMLFGIGGDSDGGADGGVDGIDGVDGSADGIDGVDGADGADGDLGDDGAHSDVAVGHDSGADSSFIRAFSVRSVSAGFAFFGLGGLGAEEFGLQDAGVLGVAALCGILALCFVWRLSKYLTKFNQDGSLSINGAIGAEGVVYLKVPAKRGGIGKVTVVQQERSVEYEAQTDNDVDLKTGEPIVVKSMLSPSLVLVARRDA